MMMTSNPSGYARVLSAALLAGGILGAAGCGTNGFSPDALIENPGAEAFLDRIEANCGKLSVGNQPLNWLLSTSNNDVVFVDVTSKFYLGQIPAAEYASNINAFYPTGTNQPALDCIFRQRAGASNQ
jgi:hypothetical protein